MKNVIVLALCLSAATSAAASEGDMDQIYRFLVGPATIDPEFPEAGGVKKDVVTCDAKSTVCTNSRGDILRGEPATMLVALVGVSDSQTLQARVTCRRPATEGDSSIETSCQSEPVRLVTKKDGMTTPARDIIAEIKAMTSDPKQQVELLTCYLRREC